MRRLQDPSASSHTATIGRQKNPSSSASSVSLALLSKSKQSVGGGDAEVFHLFSACQRVHVVIVHATESRSILAIPDLRGMDQFRR